MAYTKTTWTNDSGQAIDEDNLNKIETGIFDAHADIATNTANIATNTSAIAAGPSYTSPGAGSVALSFSDFMNLTVRVEDFGITGDGTTDDTSKVQAAIDYCETLVSATYDDVSMVTLTCNSPIGISDTLTFPAMLRFNVDFDCSVNVLGTWVNTTSDPAIFFQQKRSDMRVAVLDCNSQCAGIRFKCYTSSLHDCRIHRFVTYGLKHDTGGNAAFKDLTVQQWRQEDTEFHDRVNFTAIGIWVTESDGTYVNCDASWCAVPLKISNGGNSFFGCHFYNGSPGGDAPTEPSAWVLATAYTLGQYSKNGGNYYKCIQDNTSATGDEPGVGASWKNYWELEANYSLWVAATWVTSTAYSKDQFVTNGGNQYFCTVAHTSSATDEPGVGASWADYWEQTDGTHYIPTEPVIVECWASGPTHMSHCYFDNGHVDIYEDGLYIDNGYYLVLKSRVICTDAYIRYFNYENSTSQFQARITNLKASIAFYPYNEQYYSGNYEALNAATDQTTQYLGAIAEAYRSRTVVIPHSNNTVDTERYFKADGSITYSYNVAADAEVRTEIADGEYYIEASALRVKGTGGILPHVITLGGGETGIRELTGSVLSVYSGGAESWTFGSGNGDLVPSTDSVTNIGSVTKKVATVYCDNINQGGSTGGAGSAGAGKQYVELVIGGTTYKLLHDN